MAGQPTPDCTCGRIAVGLTVTEHRNWNPDCSQHGTDSTWWNTPDQLQERAERREQLIELQARARQARLAARTTKES